jgi:CheY-like chemotaxis protein
MERSESSKGLAIFVVEDEALLKMMIVDMIEELGHRIGCEASRLDEAERMARDCEFDLAILDVNKGNIGGKISTPVAEIVSARKLPIVFATGYGTAGLPDAFRERPCVQKPFMTKQLGGAIDRAIAAHRI